MQVISNTVQIHKNSRTNRCPGVECLQSNDLMKVVPEDLVTESVNRRSDDQLPEINRSVITLQHYWPGFSLITVQ